MAGDLSPISPVVLTSAIPKRGAFVASDGAPQIGATPAPELQKTTRPFYAII